MNKHHTNVRSQDHTPLHIGRASDLTGTDRTLYRVFEILPGALAWGSILLCVFLSYFAPVTAAIVIIVFDFYWLLKTVYLSTYLRQNCRRMRHNQTLGCSAMLQHVKSEHVYHLILLPFYKENTEVIEKGLESIQNSRYDKKKFLIVLATEERAGVESMIKAQAAQTKFAHVFEDFIITVHPKDVPGEMAGKGSNSAYAIEEARKKILDAKRIP